MILLVGAALFLTSCASAPLVSESNDQAQRGLEDTSPSLFLGQGNDEETHEDTLEALSDGDLTDPEIQGILFMREEE